MAAPVWQRVADQDAFASSMMTGVVAGTDRFVAVGTTFDPDEPPSGLAWTSADGQTWVRSGQVLDGSPAGVIWDSEKYVAFGGGASEVPAAIWTSPDGETWQRATDGPGFDEVTVMFVADLGGELFAIGGGWGDGEGPQSHVFKTWSSTDGLTWQALAAVTPPPGMVGLGGMTAANGMLVAWGASDVAPDYRPIAVRSTNGLTWQPADLGKADSRVWDIVGGDGGFVAVGSGPYCCEAGAVAPVRAWRSADAASWTKAAFQPQAGHDVLELVVAYGGGYVSLGENAGIPISWLSDDGTVWSESNSVPDAAVDGDPCTGGPCPLTTVSDMAGGSAGLVAVGQKDITDENSGHRAWKSVVWFAPPASP